MPSHISKDVKLSLSVRTRSALVFLLLLAACNPTDKRFEFYVLVEPSKSAEFIEDLQRATDSLGLKSWADRVSNREGRGLNVFEAEKGPTRIWAQNMPVNALEDERCSALGDAAVDPGQFVVSVSSTFSLFQRKETEQTYESIKNSMRRLGYKLLDKPLTCSLLASDSKLRSN